MDKTKITESNREAWNEAMDYHLRGYKIDYKEEFKTGKYCGLDDIPKNKLLEIGLEGKHIAQINCNNGKDLLSILNLGGKSGVGFDISDKAIAFANELADVSGLDAEFVRTDVYDIGEEYNDKFDLVVITIGVFVWLPDLKKLFNIMSRIMKKGATIFIYEIHPITDVFAYPGDKNYDPDHAFNPELSYFKSESTSYNSGIDYISGVDYEGKTTYEFNHPISEIINCMIQNEIQIREFNEYEDDISGGLAHLEKEHKLPLSYLLIGKKD